MRYVVEYADGTEEVFEEESVSASGIVITQGDVGYPILGLNIGMIQFTFSDETSVIINTDKIFKIKKEAEVKV